MNTAVVIGLVLAVFVVWGFVVLLLGVIAQQNRTNSGVPALATPTTTSGNAQQPSAQRTEELPQGSSRTAGSGNGNLGGFLTIAGLMILVAALIHFYGWPTDFNQGSSSVTYNVSSNPAPSANYTVNQLDYNKRTIFSPYVVSSRKAKNSYPTPPPGANLVYIGGYGCFISYLCTENCQGNPGVEGKTLHFEFYVKDRRQSSFRDDPRDTRGIRPLPNGGRVDWVVRHGSPPPSTPANAEYFFVWLVDDANSGTLRMEAKKACPL